MQFGMVIGIGALLLMGCQSLNTTGREPAQEKSIQISPLFNTPGFDKAATTTVEDRIVEAINQAVPGSSIHVSMYIISDHNSAEALVLAAERGVDVQLVLDGRNQKLEKGDAIDIMLNGFEGHSGIEKCSEEPCIKFCHGPLQFLKIGKGTIGGGCHGLIINHNKFALFSELSTGARNVVMQSSANLEDAHLHRYNDLLEVQNDKILYEGYLNYWKGLKRDHTRLTSPGDFKGDSGIIVRTSPRLIGSDPVAELLKHVTCNLPNSSVRAAQSDLGRVGVARQLARLKAAGCTINVLALNNPELKQPGKKVRDALKDSLVLTPNEWAEAGRNSIHTKMILIDAAIDGAAERTQIVLTGSQNLDLYSLKTNDECQMEIRDPAIYSQYLAFWDKILLDAKAAGLIAF